jgi:hypothetical protein
MILYHANGRHLSVPDHKELDRGTLPALIRGSGITVKESLLGSSKETNPKPLVKLGSCG